MKKTLSRRKFLSLGGMGLAAATLAACAPGLAPSLSPTVPPNPGNDGPTSPSRPAATPTSRSAAPADVAIALAAAPATVSLFSGKPTEVWQFSGRVLEGAADALQPVPNSYLGPTFRVKKGQRLNVSFTHDLPQESIVHWHGLHVPAEMDGHPQYAINKGETFEYSYKILNRAGTYWYHPHPHGITGPQVYAGMAGFFLVSDEEEQALGLPSGEFDIPLVIQDRIFDADNQLVYRANGMMGFLGEQILVNGQPDFSLPVATRPYRLRLLNGSNSRIYKLGWSDNSPFTVIATDGGLLEKPVQRPYITLAPAERVELWVDFSNRAVGDVITLKSLSFISPARGGMMGGGMMGGGSSLELGDSFDVLTVNVTRKSDDRPKLPVRLSTIERLSPGDAVATKTVTLAMRPPNGWTLNGRSFQMTAVAPEERVKLNTIEIWEFVNDGGGRGMMGGGMMLPHPMHMHGEQFQVLDRQISRSGRRAWQDLSQGFVDEGWKDTVLVMPGERVRVIRRFADFTGLFLYHCHNLEHEDMGMMRNFEIVAPSS